MAFIDCKFGSGALGQMSAFAAFIPEDATEPLKTVYLLHGLSDDYTAWQRFTRVEQYAAERGIAVIMPGGARSFYEDMVYGRNYYTHVAKEVVTVSRNIFNLSKKREDTFVAGLSMGGYGALKIALRNPDVFGAAGSLSGVLDIAMAFDKGFWDYDGKLIFGDDFKNTLRGSDADLFTLLKNAKENGTLPRIFQSCGTEDFLYNENKSFLNHAKELGVDVTYEEHPGAHCWEYWDGHITDIFDFFLKG